MENLIRRAKAFGDRLWRDTRGGPVVGSVLITLIAKILIGALISIVLGVFISAIFGKEPGAPDLDTAVSRTLRQPAAPRRVLYGERLIAGVMAFASTTADTNRHLHQIIALLGHATDAIWHFYIGDDYIPEREVQTTAGEDQFQVFSNHRKDEDAEGNKIPGPDYAKDDGTDSHARVVKHLGSELQVADSFLLDADPDRWTAAHRLRGIAYAYVNTEWDKDGRIFPNGIPNMRFLVRGRQVWDPRGIGKTIATSEWITGEETRIVTTTPHTKQVGDRLFIAGHSEAELFGETYVLSVESANAITVPIGIDTFTGGGSGGTLYAPHYSFNPALCMLDYLTNRDFGLKASEAELNLTQIQSTANLCEEQVPLTERTSDFTQGPDETDGNSRADFPDDQIFVRTDTAFAINTGTVVRLSNSGGSLPTPLAAGTDYYYVFITVREFRLATSLSNLEAGTFVDCSDAGTGTHTLTRVSQQRFTCNGIFETGERHKPIQVLEDMATSIAGSLVSIQGKYNIFAAQATTATVTLDEDDLRGDIIVDSGPAKADIFNRVTGSFISPHDFWVRADFPAVSNKTYAANDGGVFTREIDLRYTQDPVEAQRIAKIHLEKSRQGITVNMPCKLTVLQVQPWDVVKVNNAALGWVNKEFRVTSYILQTTTEGVGIDLLLQEEASSAYDWNQGEETQIDTAPDTQLPVIGNVAAPVSISAVSGTAELTVAGDGSVVSNMRISWGAALDSFVRFYELQWKKQSDSTYSSILVGSDTLEYIVAGVTDGVTYDIRVRSISIRGPESDFVSDTHVVIGKTEVPPNVTTFNVQRLGDGTRKYTWTSLSIPADVRAGGGYRIRYELGTTLTWATATDLVDGLLIASPFESNQLAPGTYTIGIKQVDSTGNESVTEQTLTVTLAEPRRKDSLDFGNEFTTGWPGTKTDCFVNYRGYLESIGDVGISPQGDWASLPDTWAEMPDTWGEQVESVSPIAYENLVIDIGIDARFSPLLTTVGDGTITTFMRTHTAAEGSDLSAEPYVAITEVVGQRYVQFKVQVSGTAPILKAFSWILDAEIVTVTFADVDTATETEPWFESLGVGHFIIADKTGTLATIQTAAIVAYHNLGGGSSWELITKDQHLTGFGVAVEFKLYDNNSLEDAVIDVELRGPKA